MRCIEKYSISSFFTCRHMTCKFLLHSFTDLWIADNIFLTSLFINLPTEDITGPIFSSFKATFSDILWTSSVFSITIQLTNGQFFPNFNLVLASFSSAGYPIYTIPSLVTLSGIFNIFLLALYCFQLDIHLSKLSQANTCCRN